MLSRALNSFGGRAVRRLSSDAHGHEEHVAIAKAWEQRTYMALPVLAALAFANVYIHMSHDHHHEERAHFHYEKKLLKKYPWKADTCNLFDYDCKKAYYAKATGKASGKGHH